MSKGRQLSIDEAKIITNVLSNEKISKTDRKMIYEIMMFLHNSSIFKDLALDFYNNKDIINSPELLNLIYSMLLSCSKSDEKLLEYKVKTITQFVRKKLRISEESYFAMIKKVLGLQKLSFDKFNFIKTFLNNNPFKKYDRTGKFSIILNAAIESDITIRGIEILKMIDIISSDEALELDNKDYKVLVQVLLNKKMANVMDKLLKSDLSKGKKVIIIYHCKELLDKGITPDKSILELLKKEESVEIGSKEYKVEELPDPTMDANIVLDDGIDQEFKEIAINLLSITNSEFGKQMVYSAAISPLLLRQSKDTYEVVLETISLYGNFQSNDEELNECINTITFSLVNLLYAKDSTNSRYMYENFKRYLKILSSLSNKSLFKYKNKDTILKHAIRKKYILKFAENETSSFYDDRLFKIILGLLDSERGEILLSLFTRDEVRYLSNKSDLIRIAMEGNLDEIEENFGYQKRKEM